MIKVQAGPTRGHHRRLRDRPSRLNNRIYAEPSATKRRQQQHLTMIHDRVAHEERRSGRCIAFSSPTPWNGHSSFSLLKPSLGTG